MTMYARGPSTGARVVAETDDFVSWIAHPAETGERASHAIRTDEGVWVFDPLDAPEVDGLIDSLGEVVGVAVLSAYHARDAGELARRHDAAVHLPAWMDRVEERVAAPVERYTLAPSPAFRVLPCRPLPGWQEVFLYHEPSGTLVSPDSLGTAGPFLVGDERLGLSTFRRLQPPTQLSGLRPETVLVGHGDPVTDGAGRALAAALDGARSTFPKALLANGVDGTRAILAAFRD